MKIAILEDDQSMLNFISSTLSPLGHQCKCFVSGKELMHALRRESFDMLILDWMVPDTSGVDVLIWTRHNLTVKLPVLFITNRTSEDDIVSVLNAGADDYIIKPVRKSEIVARVQALFRRTYQELDNPGTLQFGKYMFEVKQGRINVDGELIPLTPKEFSLALLLFRHLGRPISRSHILDTLWQNSSEANSHSLDTHLSRLRKKIGIGTENGFRLLPVYGYGYRLEPAEQLM